MSLTFRTSRVVEYEQMKQEFARKYAGAKDVKGYCDSSMARDIDGSPIAVKSSGSAPQFFRKSGRQSYGDKPHFSIDNSSRRKLNEIRCSLNEVEYQELQQFELTEPKFKVEVLLTQGGTFSDLSALRLCLKSNSEDELISWRNYLVSRRMSTGRILRHSDVKYKHVTSDGNTSALSQKLETESFKVSDNPYRACDRREREKKSESEAFASEYSSFDSALGVDTLRSSGAFYTLNLTHSYYLPVRANYYELRQIAPSLQFVGNSELNTRVRQVFHEAMSKAGLTSFEINKASGKEILRSYNALLLKADSAAFQKLYYQGKALAQGIEFKRDEDTLERNSQCERAYLQYESTLLLLSDRIAKFRADRAEVDKRKAERGKNSLYKLINPNAKTARDLSKAENAQNVKLSRAVTKIRKLDPKFSAIQFIEAAMLESLEPAQVVAIAQAQAQRLEAEAAARGAETMLQDAMKQEYKEFAGMK